MTVATQTIVERRGDDAKDRQASLGHHAPEVETTPPVEVASVPETTEEKPSVMDTALKAMRDVFPI